MVKSADFYLAFPGADPKYPTLQENISQTRSGHGRISGGCEYCFAARDPSSMKRPSLCKFCYPVSNKRVGSLAYFRLKVEKLIHI